MTDKSVTLTHPDSEHSITVSASHADTYISQGWTEKSSKAKTDTK